MLLLAASLLASDSSAILCSRLFIFESIAFMVWEIKQGITFDQTFMSLALNRTFKNTNTIKLKIGPNQKSMSVWEMLKYAWYSAVANLVSSYRLLFTDDAALLPHLLLIFALTGLQHLLISHVRLHLGLQDLLNARQPTKPEPGYHLTGHRIVKMTYCRTHTPTTFSAKVWSPNMEQRTSCQLENWRLHGKTLSMRHQTSTVCMLAWITYFQLSPNVNMLWNLTFILSSYSFSFCFRWVSKRCAVDWVSRRLSSSPCTKIHACMYWVVKHKRQSSKRLKADKLSFWHNITL